MSEEEKDKFGLDKYEIISALNLPYEDYYKAIDIIVDKILKHYSPDRIILQKHYDVNEYCDNGILETFNNEMIRKNKLENEHIKKMDDYFLYKINNCHIIEFPDNVLADKNHKWGLNPLHYIEDYYQYAADAFEIILMGIPLNEENYFLEKSGAHTAKLSNIFEIICIHKNFWGGQTTRLTILKKQLMIISRIQNWSPILNG